MTQNLFELYELFNHLQELVFHNNYSDRNISLPGFMKERLMEMLKQNW
jgi:hypothetical protein